jgi:type IV pilus assembly protein PilC
MSYLADFYEEEADSALKNFSVILEPILLILVGLFVAFIALSIITPIYQFTSNL